METGTTKTFAPGTRLPNGAVVLEIVAGDLNTMALCLWGCGVDPFVVWHIGPNGEAFWGRYFPTALEAATYFEKRKKGGVA